MKVERSLVKRIIGLAAASVGAVILLALLAAYLLLKAHVERAFDARLDRDARDLLVGVTRRADGMLALESVPEDGRYDERLSGWYWVIRDRSADNAIIARSRSLATLDLPLSTPGGAATIAGPAGSRLRALTLASKDASAAPFLVTIAAPQSEVDSALMAELVPLAAGLLALALLLVGVLWFQVRRSFAPLRQLAEDIERLQAGHIALLPASPYSEIDRLTVTINGLLARARDLVARNRDRAAKLAHALKTPLALIAARAGTHGSAPDDKVAEAVAAMQRQIDHNLKRTRASAGTAAFASRVPVAEVVADLMFALGHAYAERGLTSSVAIPANTIFIGDREDLEEMLGNLIENAHKWARTSVAVSAHVSDQHLEVTIEDDGPGFPTPIPLDTSANMGANHVGLGLDLTREIATAYSGSLLLGISASGGAKATLRFPHGHGRPIMASE